MKPFHTDDRLTIWHANALDLPIDDATVDLIVTSPPYFGLRSYQDGGEHYAGQIGDEATPAEFVDALVAATREMVRVLKPSGSIWVNLGDKYNAYNGNRGDGAIQGNGPRPRIPGGSGFDVAGMRPKSLIGVPWRYALRCIDDLGLILRAEVIWSKPNGLPESVTDRVRRSHETWFHLTKEPRYYSAVDEVREEHAPAGLARREYGFSVNPAQSAGNNPVLNGEGMRPANPLGKLPGSVWTIPTQPLRVPAHLGIDHFAAFPMEWPRRIIRGWSPAGVCVECGEGRRPVVERERTHNRKGRQVNVLDRPSRGVDTQGLGWESQTTITGYACACPDTTAPTRPRRRPRPVRRHRDHRTRRPRTRTPRHQRRPLNRLLPPRTVAHHRPRRTSTRPRSRETTPRHARTRRPTRTTRMNPRPEGDTMNSTALDDIRDAETLDSAVYTALGAASMCWETLSGAGVFQSDRALEIGKALLERIEKVSA